MLCLSGFELYSRWVPLRYKYWQPLFACLEVDWFEFHLSSFNGVVISLPVIPVHSVSKWRVSTAMIEAVQVGIMTVIVPPGPLIACSTVIRPDVIVSIFSGERVASLTSQRVTSISWKMRLEEMIFPWMYLHITVILRWLISKNSGKHWIRFMVEVKSL